jgi:branched-chain amino acid transport system substrate-binding protein
MVVLVVALCVAVLAACSPKGAEKDAGASDVSDASGASGAGAGQSGSADAGAGSEASFDGTITIGINDCLTGAGAVYGLPEVQAMRIAIKEINEAGGVDVDGKKMELKAIEYDNKSDPNEAVNALRKLIDKDGVKIIAGWATTGSTMAAAQMMGGEDAMMMVACAGELSITTQGYPNVQRIRPPGAYTGGPCAEFLYEKGERKVAVLGQLKDSMRAQYTDEFTKKFKELGGEIVGVETFEDTDKDMYTQLTKIMKLKPDAIFIPGFVEPVAFAVSQAHELGFEGELYGFCGGSKEQFLTVLTEEQLEGLYDILPVEGNVEALGETAKAYDAKYSETYGENPPPNAIYGYDAIYAIKAGVEAAGTSDDIAAISKAIRTMPVAPGAGMEYMTVGDHMFDENGQCYTINIAVQWKDGERVLVKKLVSDPTAFSKYMSGLTAENKAKKQ